MSHHGIKKDAAVIGFYQKRIVGGEAGRPTSRWACKCSKCNEETTWGWGINSSPELMLKSAQNGGWEYSRRNLVCPKCVKETKGVKKVSNIGSVPNPKLQRKVFALLDDHFDEELRLYRAGWSDKKVADEAQTSEQFVENLRKGAYGELAEDPAVTALKTELIGVEREAKTIADELMERFGKIESTITALRGRIDKFVVKKVS